MPSPPYRASWVDRFIDVVDRLPIPTFVFYSVLGIVGAAMLHVAAWIDGALSTGQIDGVLVFSGAWVVVAIGLMHLLNRVAASSVERIRPLMSESTADDLRYRLTHMPARVVLALWLVAAVGLGATLLSTPDFIYDGMSSPVSFALGIVVIAWAYGLAPVLVFYLVRQLVLIHRAFSEVENLSILHQQPLYGLSRVPFWSGVAVLMIINLGIVDTVIRDLTEAEAAINALANFALVPVAIAAFVVPLLGIHGRMREAKSSLLEDNGRHIEIAQERLYESVRKGDHPGVEASDTALTSLYRARDEIRGLKTWPWSPGTVRSFLSALFIPMILWALQLFGDRVL